MSGPQAEAVAACILIVEDDMMLAMLLEDQLADLGLRTITASRVAAAVPIAASEAIDAAILDVNVAGDPIYPVAEALRARGIRFAFATGYGVGGLKADYRDSPTLRKPYAVGELERTVNKLLSPAGPGA